MHGDGLVLGFGLRSLASEVWPRPKTQGRNLGGLACCRPAKFTFYLFYFCRV